MIDDEAIRLRDSVDDLAQRCACLDDWRLADARLLAAVVEGQAELAELHESICRLAAGAQYAAWVEARERASELREVLDDLRVLRMCVQSRIYELEAGARPYG